METKTNIDQLVQQVLGKLKEMGYSENTYNAYYRLYKKLARYASNREIHVYSKELGLEFLHAFCTLPEDWEEKMPRNIREPVRCIRTLTEYQEFGRISRRVCKKKEIEYPFYNEIMKDYKAECDLRCYSPSGMRTRMYRLSLFVDFLQRTDVTPNAITSAHLSQFTTTLMGRHAKSIASIHTTIRSFLQFLYLKGFHEKDLSSDVLHFKTSYGTRIPSVWKVEDIKKMLDGVDRGNPTGKRDYAILLLVTRLGMRVGDIKSMKLSDLQWEYRRIKVVQQKTSRTVDYPILEDIGWAIIDYLKEGRPKTDTPFLFVRHNAPFEPFGMYANLHNIITKHARRAGIVFPKEQHHGLHSLRHTLAKTLLDMHTPLGVISEVLGHMDIQSTKVYLSIDMEGLRSCALDPQTVFDHDLA